MHIGLIYFYIGVNVAWAMMIPFIYDMEFKDEIKKSGIKVKHLIIFMVFLPANLFQIIIYFSFLGICKIIKKLSPVLNKKLFRCPYT